MFEWLFAKESTTKISDAKEPIARFEVLSSDDKFLDLASTLEDLSPLDKCYHIVSNSKFFKCDTTNKKK